MITEISQLEKFLQDKSIKYSLEQYESHLKSAEDAAAQLNISTDHMLKSLLFTDGEQYFLFLVPVMSEVDENKAAALTKSKLYLAPVQDIEKVTGYKVGCVTPINMRSAIPVFIDESVRGVEEVAVGSGVKGWELFIAPGDLAGFVGGEFMDLTGNYGLE